MTRFISTKPILRALIMALLFMPLTNANASDGIFDVSMPADGTESAKSDAHSNQMTHPVLNLTPDKSELITLDQEAASVVVGNPNHLSVMLDTPETLVVIPRAPGASHFTVIGKDGSILMQRHVVVGVKNQETQDYVRIRRSCGSNSGTACQATSVYYCPDICHEVSLDQQGTSRRR